MTSTAPNLSTLTNATAYSPEWSWKAFTWSYSDIMHLVSAVLGIIGNVLVLLALRKRRAVSRSTDTLVGALAAADFLTSIFIIPVPSAKTVPVSALGQLYCKMTLPGFFLFVSFTSSIYILTAISMERFLAVVYPLFFNRLLTRRMILIVIAVIWVTSFVLYTVFITTAVVVNPETHSCTLHFNSSSAKAIYGYFMFFLRLILPTSIMTVTQIVIAITLQRRSVEFSGQIAVSFHLKARNRVLKLMFVVVIVYIITWGPGQISFFLFTIGVLPPTYIGGPLHKFIIVLSTYNSCVNPMIYIAWFPEFRKALKQLFFCNNSADSAPIFDDHKTEVSTITTTAQDTESNL